jgi:hypothetical protein
MKHKILKALIFATVVLSSSVASNGETPKGWFAAGSHPKDYEMSHDRTGAHGGNACAYLKSVVADTGGFGTLMQMFKADEYRGKRVRMSGYVKAKDASDWAGLWMRVDGARKDEMLAFDNMQDRAIKGTIEWKKYEIVLDVPENSEMVAFGLLLSGKGQVWMDDLQFEVVGKDVPTTGRATAGAASGAAKAPLNLNFEE